MRTGRWLLLTVATGLLALLLAPALVAAVGPDTGYLEVCKASDGSGVSGTFRFTVGAQTVSVPVDACSAPLRLPVGPITVTEEPVPGVAVASIAVAPSDREVSTSLPARSAQVNVVSGGIDAQTLVTFTNRSEIGNLTVCKAAGAGIAAGTNFTFTVAGRSIAVPVGACRDAGSFPYGTLVTVAEVSESTTRVMDIGVIPPNRMVGAPSLTDGTVTVAIGPLATQVTFTNDVRPLGSLQICKRSGVTNVTGTYTFTVAGQRVEVPVGLCSAVLRVPEGVATVSEVLRADARVAGIATAPAQRLVRTDLAGGTAQVEILAGNLTTVTFTNELQMSQVKVCKVAGAGVTLGAQFSFSVAGQAVSVPAGSCALAGSFPIGTLVTVTEAIPAGMRVVAINVAPHERISVAPSLTSGSVTVLTGAGVTEVTVTNQSVTQPTLATTPSTTPALTPPTTPVTIPPSPTTTVPMSTTSTVPPTIATTVPTLATTSTTTSVPVTTPAATTVPVVTTSTTVASITPTSTTTTPATTSTTLGILSTSTTVPGAPAPTTTVALATTSTTAPLATTATTSSLLSTSTTVPAATTSTTVVPLVSTTNTVVSTSQTTIPVVPCVPATTVPIVATTTTSVAGQTTTPSTQPGVDMTNSCDLTSRITTPTTVVGRLLDRVTVPLTTARLAVTGLGTSLFLTGALAAFVVGAALLLAPLGLNEGRSGHRRTRVARRAPSASRRWDALSGTPQLRRRRRHRHRSRNVWRY